MLTPVPVETSLAHTFWTTRLRELLGPDRAAVSTLLVPGWSSVAGVGTLATAGSWTLVSLHLHHVALALLPLPPIPLAPFLLATILNIIAFTEVLYLRARKQEKLIVSSIAAALWTALALRLGRLYGAYGIAIGYLAGGIGIGLGTYTVITWRRIWHGE